MPSGDLLYLESDGQVYLVRGPDGAWTFPTVDAGLPFEYEVRHETTIQGRRVVFARPRLAAWPHEWVFKDDVPTMPDVDPIVQRAINASLARCVVGVILVRNDDRVLMVKSNRGFTKGMWNVPGGFIEYGEAPEVAAAREAREETGLDVRVKELLGVFTKRFESPYFMYGLMYDAEPLTSQLAPDASEIEACEWMEPRRAFTATHNPFAQAALRKRFGIS